MKNKIHPTALIDPGARIGRNVSIGAYTVIEDNVSIDDDSEIGHHVVVLSGTRLGRGVRAHPGAVIGGPPQDLKYQDEETFLEVGDMTVIRECVTVSKGTKETGLTKIGSNCMLMSYSHVAHDCRLGDNVILANSVNLAGHVTIEENVIIGGLTGVHQFVVIGSNVMIGALFRVSKDIPPYVLAGGQPLSFERLNIVGLRRRGFSPNTIEAIGDAYHIIYRSNLNVSQALEKLSTIDGLIPEVERIVRFIQNSKRGIIPAKVR